MDKKQTDRRPTEKPVEHDRGSFDPTKPESGRRIPETPEKPGKPAGHPLDKEMPKPSAGKRFNDSERSDRESGRPVQLEEDESPKR
jgi:hypothetical protein